MIAQIIKHFHLPNNTVVTDEDVDAILLRSVNGRDGVYVVTIWFLLIYRHLQNTYWFKRGNCLLPVPRIEALALPYPVEQTTLESTPI